VKALLAFACVIAMAACQRSTSEDELAGAKAQVQGFFDALGRGDCATLGSLVPAASGAAHCDKFLHEWRDDLKIQLVAMSDVKRDGRDKRAIIVTTTVMRHGEQQTMLVRVTHEQGVWHLVL
jgi:hypothetical protein